MNNKKPASMHLNLIKFMVLGVGILTALYLAMNRVNFQKQAATKTATLSLTASPSSVAAGANMAVTVNLNTGGSAIRGVDIRMSYDKTKLKIISVATAASGTTLQTFAPITSSNTFDVTKVVTNGGTNCVGNICYIEFGAITANLTNSTITTAYNGSTSLAIVTFQGVAAGSTTIALESVSGTTTDSNVVSDTNPPEDILNTVTNASVTVTGGTAISCATYDFGGTVGTIDITDIQKVAAQFNKVPVAGSTDKYDFDHNNVINILDIQNIAGKWNKVCQ